MKQKIEQIIPDVDTNKPGWKKHIKKMLAKKAIELYQPFIIDMNKYTLDKNCKKCKGTGYIGYSMNGVRIICGCMKITKEYKEILKKQIEDESKKKSNKSLIKRGDFKGYKKVKKDDDIKKEKLIESINLLPVDK